MTKTLIIVESPAKATKIQSFLSKDYIVLASKGHITELAKGGKFGLGVDIEHDFKPHYVLMEDKISTLNELISAAKTVDQIYMGTDEDREGWSIAWHLSQRLADVGKPIKRVIFNEITKSVIKKSIANPMDIDMRIVHAQEARRILDRLVGFMASPFLMNLFGPKLSAGRVQSVLTRMVIDRERQIEAFIPEEFWTFQVNLSKDGQEGFATKYTGRPIDQKTADNIKAKLNAKDAQFIVSEVISNAEPKYPQAPMITSSLQRFMSKEHGFAADRTMKVAQSLYEGGYCTYIRTDSVRASDESVAEVRQWLTDNNFKTPMQAISYNNKDSAQDAHECIRPSDLSLNPDNNYAMVDTDEKLVYEVIWKHFIASQMLPAIYDTLKITAHVIGDNSAEVKASGKALKSRGYLEILGIVDNSKIDLPMLHKNDILNHFGKNPVKMEKKKTQPPPRYSVDKILKELEDRSIGRPATYADLLSKITSRNYVEQKGAVFHATDLGKKITDELMQFFTFMNYNYTAQLEKQLDEIENGKLNHIDMLKKFYPAFKQELDTAYLKHGGTLCDKCQSPMASRTAGNGSKFLGCSNFPKCKNTKNVESTIQL